MHEDSNKCLLIFERSLDFIGDATYTVISDQKGLASSEINDLERVWTLPKSVSSQVFQDLQRVLTFQLLRIKL